MWFVCVQFQLQIFDIVCSTSWANRDKCCELPALVSSLVSDDCSHVTTAEKPSGLLSAAAL